MNIASIGLDRIVTAEYMAEGYDGFVPLKQGNHIVGHENGLMMYARSLFSSIYLNLYLIF